MLFLLWHEMLIACLSGMVGAHTAVKASLGALLWLLAGLQSADHGTRRDGVSLRLGLSELGNSQARRANI